MARGAEDRPVESNPESPGRRRRILHLADLHLGDGQDYLGPKASARRAEADGLLGRIVDAVLAPGSAIGGIVIAGDLFDHHDPPPPLIESVLSDLKRLAEAGIRVLTVPGNHDEYSYPSCVYRRHGPRWPDTLVTHPTPGKADHWDLAGCEVDLYAMAYVAGRSRPPYDRIPLEESPFRKVAVLHGSLDADWSDRSLPLRSAHLVEEGLDYVALGHIHRPMERRLARGWVCYPGRIEGGGFHDPGGAGLVTIDLGEAELAPRRQAFPSRRIEEERWSLSSLESEAELEARLESAADSERILRLTLYGLPGFALEPERLRERWGPRFYHLEIQPPEEGAETAPMEELAAERTVRGAFVGLAAARIEEAKDPDRRRLCEAAVRHGLAAFGPREDL